jgi:hypothetical protein
MVSPEKQVAQEVHELLVEAHPQRDHVNLARVAEITAAKDHPLANDKFRGDVFLSVQRLRQAIADGASASEAEELLLAAISSSERSPARAKPKSFCSQLSARRNAGFARLSKAFHSV